MLNFYRFLVEAVENADRGRMMEILHAIHMHPENRFPVRYREDLSGRSPTEFHDDIRNQLSASLYNDLDSHAKASADAVKEHLSRNGINPEHITDVAWTSNGSKDILQFTGIEDPDNESDVMYRICNPETGEAKHIGVSLKYGERELNVKNPGLETLQRKTGASNLIQVQEEHRARLHNLGYTGAIIKEHEVWKADKFSPRGIAAVQSKQMATRQIASFIRESLGLKSTEQLKEYIKNLVVPPTKNPVIRVHVKPSSKTLVRIMNPRQEIDDHLSQFHSLYVDPESTGSYVTIKGITHGGETRVVMKHGIKGKSGPIKNIVATTKMPGIGTRRPAAPAESLGEDAPANSMGAAGISGASTAVDAGVAGYDKLLGGSPLRRKPPQMLGTKYKRRRGTQ
jgi:hypothetical protein